MRLREVNCLAGLLAPEQQNAASVGYPTIEHYQENGYSTISKEYKDQANNLMEQGKPDKDLRMLRHGREGDELESAGPI